MADPPASNLLSWDRNRREISFWCCSSAESNSKRCAGCPRRSHSNRHPKNSRNRYRQPRTRPHHRTRSWLPLDRLRGMKRLEIRNHCHQLISRAQIGLDKSHHLKRGAGGGELRTTQVSMVERNQLKRRAARGDGRVLQIRILQRSRLKRGRPAVDRHAAKVTTVQIHSGHESASLVALAILLAIDRLDVRLDHLCPRGRRRHPALGDPEFLQCNQPTHHDRQYYRHAQQRANRKPFTAAFRRVHK